MQVITNIEEAQRERTEWEVLNTTSPTTARLRVPGGWIYRVGWSDCMYVPDPMIWRGPIPRGPLHF